MQEQKSILITGASSGLGRALALEYSAPNHILLLTGRNLKRLEDTALLCKSKGAQVISKALDVRDKTELKAWILEMASTYSLDLAIINAGISAGTASGPESADQIEEIFAVNLEGALDTINAVSEFMLAKPRQAQKQTRGQIALISSLAAFRGLPSSPAYSASKAALRIYGQGLRGLLAKEGIKVNVVCPGYIKTPMTAVNNFYMPFLMEASRAALIIRRGLEKNQPQIAFPLPLYWLIWLLSLLPLVITDVIFARLPAKSQLKK